MSISVSSTQLITVVADVLRKSSFFLSYSFVAKLLLFYTSESAFDCGNFPVCGH